MLVGSDVSKGPVLVEFREVILSNITQVNATRNGWVHTFDFINDWEIRELAANVTMKEIEQRHWIEKL
jgi:hypothetical protein